VSLLSALGGGAAGFNEIQAREAKQKQQEFENKIKILASFDPVAAQKVLSMAQAQSVEGVRSGQRPGDRSFETEGGTRFAPPGAPLPQGNITRPSPGAFSAEEQFPGMFNPGTDLKRKKSTPMFGSQEQYSPDQLKDLGLGVKNVSVGKTGGQTVSYGLPTPKTTKVPKVIDYETMAIKNVTQNYSKKQLELIRMGTQSKDEKVREFSSRQQEAIDKEIIKEKQRLIKLYGGFRVRNKKTGKTGWVSKANFNKEIHEKVAQ